MSHTTITTSLLTVEQQNKVQAALSELGIASTFAHVEPRFTYEVWNDEYTDINFIRECTNGVVWLRSDAERRYRLSDEGAELPFAEGYYAFTNLEGKKYVVDGETYESIYEMAYQHRGEMRELYASGAVSEADMYRAQEALDAIHETYPDDELVLRDDVALCLPIYLIDHSGISVSHASFGCPWDSGQVGWHYMTRETLDLVFNGDEDAARRCLEVEIEEMDAILQGDVWGYTITDEEGDLYESCGGFINAEDDALDQLLNHAAKEHHDGLREAWERQFKY